MDSHHCAIPDTGKGLLAALVVVLFWSGFNIVLWLSGAIALPLFLDEQLGPTTIAGIVVVSVGAMLCSLG